MDDTGDPAAPDSGGEPCVAGVADDGTTWTMETCDVQPGMYFGAAETGAGHDGWYGEDCILDPDDDRDDGVEVCHHFAAGSSQLTLTRVDEPGEVSETTTMIGYPGSAEWTYVLGSDWGCVSWGPDSPAYYAELGCTAY